MGARQQPITEEQRTRILIAMTVATNMAERQTGEILGVTLEFGDEKYEWTGEKFAKAEELEAAREHLSSGDRQ